MSTAVNQQLDLARKFIETTGKNLFLTGKAGTGKTTFLRELRRNSPKRMVVVAPTGVAAINAEGVTIHSFFQLPFGPQIPNHYLPEQERRGELSIHLNREKLNIIRSLDLLVIDEISMVRADLLDAMDGVLRRVRRRAQPFGGVQVLMIGDLQQLAPVVKEDDWAILRPYYAGPFFFQSKVLEQFPAETIELTTIFRQKDKEFIDLLNQIRENRLTPQGFNKLNSRYNPNIQQAPGYITLTSHNRQAQYINEQKLQAIPFKPQVFKASIEGEFPEFAYPNDVELVLKKGAQVMFIKNDISRDKLFYNGKIGVVESISDQTVMVRCDGEGSAIAVGPAEWQNFKFSLNSETNEIEETITGTFTQHPLKLAWAITIHKSQGLTFEKAIIDANAAFAHGQVYVALSRCRTLEGLILSSPIDQRSIINSQSVNHFIEQAGNNTPTAERILAFQIEYERELVSELFNFKRLQYQLGNLQKEILNNRNALVGSFPDKLPDLITTYNTTIVEVSEKFQSQLHQLFLQQLPAASHEQLQDRIKKACSYFLNKTIELIRPLTLGLELETDNKAIRKTITDHLERINQSYNTHHDCLKACSNGFNISSYLSAKSVSAIQKESAKARLIKETKSLVTSSHPELYYQLRTWRNNKADDLNQPHYMIISTKALVELSNSLPLSIKELLKIKGFGKRKAEQFGKELLGLVHDYRVDKKMESPAPDLSPEPEKIKPLKIPSWQITLDLIRMGLTPEQAAKKRSLAFTTIESHLAEAVGKGELDVSKVVSVEKIRLVNQRLEGKQVHSLTVAKELVGDAVTYGELRLIITAKRGGRPINAD